MMSVPEFPTPVECSLGRCLWQAGKINEFGKMLTDSGLTRRLTPAQLKRLSEKVKRDG